MHNSMAVLNAETRRDHNQADLDALKPLAEFAALNEYVTKVIPSLEQILERKEIYATIQALKDATDLTEEQKEQSQENHDIRTSKGGKSLALSEATRTFLHLKATSDDEAWSRGRGAHVNR